MSGPEQRRFGRVSPGPWPDGKWTGRAEGYQGHSRSLQGWILGRSDWAFREGPGPVNR